MSPSIGVRPMTMTNALIQSDFYRTADISLATAIALTYPIEAIDRQNPRKAEFLFKKQDGLSELIEKYWRGELRVDPNLYFQQLRIVKARLYNQNNE